MNIAFNDDWIFHLGELEEPVKKFCSKAGCCGGPSMLTQEEGFVYHLPPHLQAVFGDGNGNAFYNVAPSIGDGWKKVRIPHDWKIEQDYVEPKQANDVMSGVLITDASKGYLPDGVAYYRKTFAVPDSYKDKKIFLEFEGVLRDCTVWINGTYAGSHLNGYTGFRIDIGDHLFYGDEGKNVVLVKTDTTCDEGWWGEGAGIYRNVWLLVKEQVHFARNGIFVYNGSLSKESAEIVLEMEIENEEEDLEVLTVEASITDPNGCFVCKKNISVESKGYETAKVKTIISIDDPVLWEVLDGKLYEIDICLKENEKVIDRKLIHYGIRDIRYEYDGLYVNGNKTEIKGVCVHQDMAGVGIGLTKDLMRYRLEKILSMGANAYRSAHHPASHDLLDLCDEMGILVLNENRRLDPSKDGIEDLEDLIKGSRNHPCIFMWSLENEEFIATLPPGKRLLRRIVKKAKQLDPSRLVTMAGQFAKGDKDYVSIPDVAGFNYDDGDAARMREEIKGLKIITSEDSSYVSTRNIYVDDPKKGHCDSYDSGNYYMKLAMGASKPAELAAGTAGGAVAPGYFVYCWNHFKHEEPDLGGLFVWTAFDYRGETFPYNWPQINSQYGAMDMCGFEKDVFYYWKSLWDEKPMVHVLPNWNWVGQEGKQIQVDVYSNCEEVEIFVNGKSQGRKENVFGTISSWIVSYEPGELKAVSYIGEMSVCEDARITSGDAARLKLECIYEGADEILVQASVLDEKGNLCPTASPYLSFHAQGADVIGVGNGDPSCHEKDKGTQRSAFNGLALAILRRNGISPITVGVGSTGFETQEITIRGIEE